MVFQLPALPYWYDALEPVIDSQTMRIHYEKHHQAYLNNLNAVLAGSPYESWSIEDLLSKLDQLTGKIYTTVRNHWWWYYNHMLFWTCMSPWWTPVSTEFQQILVDNFGSLDQLKQLFADASLWQFGSGWAWIVMTEDYGLEIVSTPNQDSPLSIWKRPILGLDVWEHAYYLQYQNRRVDYVQAWWGIINRQEVENRYRSCL